MTQNKCHYGKIAPEEWHQPDWIDEDKASAAREEMIRKKVIYGHSVPYRNMCRYNSGVSRVKGCTDQFFFRHPLLEQYDYYWRVEPSIKLFCDITYDPFLVMQDQQKVYGFTLSLFEYVETIPTLWDAVKEFIELHPEHIAEGNAMKFLSGDGGETYNLCHFWSNFEIGDLNFWRSPAYIDFFNHLDKLGGFYYERWGDAPVHSIAAALFAPKEKIHWFDDIGYRHEPFQVGSNCYQADGSIAHRATHILAASAGAIPKTTLTGNGIHVQTNLQPCFECIYSRNPAMVMPKRPAPMGIELAQAASVLLPPSVELPPVGAVEGWVEVDVADVADVEDGADVDAADV